MDPISDIFIWDSHFETGISELDRQHRVLVELINDMGKILVTETDTGSIETSLMRIFDELSKYVDFHFSFEENLMQPFPDEEHEAAHRQAHEAFVRHIMEVKASAGENPVETVGKTLSFMTKWLMKHIIGTDMRFARKILALESGMSAEEARRHAEDFMMDSNGAMLHALNMLYDNLAIRTQDLIEAKRKLTREIDAHKLTEFELHKFSRAVEHSPVSILITDVNGVFEYVNPKFTQLTGYAFHELDGKTPSILKSGMMGAGFYEELWQTISSGQEWHCEFHNRKKNGELYWDHASISPIFDPNGKITHYVSIQENITERKHALEELKHQKEFSEVIINSLPGIFYMLDMQGDIAKVNPQFSSVTGYSLEELAGMNARDFFEGQDRARIAEKIGEVFEKGESWVEAELVVKSGRKIPYFFTGHRMLMEDGYFLVGLGTDISERRKLEEELVRQARTDMLTGLPNRRHFLELAQQELVRAKRYGNLFSILMIDLDEFKSVNDEHGHQTGDRVLVKFAEICRNTIRSFDIAGRMGGEEFAVLLPETEMDRAFEAAERLRQRIFDAEMAAESGKVFRFSVSIGVATLSPESDNIDSLLGSADRALYAAKRSGRNRVFRA